MPRDSSGNCTRTNGVFSGSTTWAQQAASADKTINSSRHDTHDEDLATMLTDSWSRSGKGAALAALSMGNFRLTNLGDATARTDAAKVSQVQDSTYTTGTDTGAADAYVVSLTPAITSYQANQLFLIKIGAGNTNTGASTININSVGVTSIKLPDGTDPAAGQLVALQAYFFYNDGTNFVVLNPTPIKLEPGSGSELTIATGNVVATEGYHTIDTEADAATDDLDTIDDANFDEGDLLIIRAENTARTVVVKNGSGNHTIHTASGSDVSLSNDEHSITLQLRSGEWYEVAQSAGGATQSNVATTSGTSVEITGFAAGTREITLSLEGVSQNSAGQVLIIQLGDASSYETSGYSGCNNRHAGGSTHAITAQSSSFILGSGNASDVLTGQARLVHMGGNVWSFSWVGDDDVGTDTYTASGNKTLTGELTRVRLTTSGGTATFDAGTLYRMSVV